MSRINPGTGTEERLERIEKQNLRIIELLEKQNELLERIGD